MTAARGLRNHNPGNLIDLGTAWDGLALVKDRTEAQLKEHKFCVFKAPWWGIRAMTRVLHRYYHHHGLKTVETMLNRYAPAHENPTNEYQQHVAKAMGVKPSTQLLLNYTTMEGLVRAIIEFENGANPYSWELPAGLIMAGYEPLAVVQENGTLHYRFKV